MTLHNALCTAALSLTVLAALAEPAQPHRIMPLRAMTEDVEILHGDPDKAGEPFVMRIRELPGTIIPPHRHPIDEHITVVQGTLYFGAGDRFDRSAMREVKVGEYVFIPKGSTMFGYSPRGRSSRCTARDRSTSTGAPAVSGSRPTRPSTTPMLPPYSSSAKVTA